MDRLAAGDFIRSLFADVGGPVELTAIRNGRVVPDFLLGDECLADELSYVLPDLERLNEQGYAIYYSISTKLRSWAPSGGRGGQDLAWRFPAFWADVDTKSTGDDLPALFKALHRFDPQPSLIIATGGGVQALWLLETPLEREAYLTTWKNVNQGLQQAVRSDPVHNADRLLRLPGSINHKYDAKPMATVMWHGWGTRYAPEVFERFRIAEPPRVARPRVVRTGGANDGYLSAADVAAMLPAVKRGDAWMAPCPAHADHNPSLSIADGEHGTLLHCFAGCELHAICDALGIRVGQLFKEQRNELTNRDDLRIA